MSLGPSNTRTGKKEVKFGSIVEFEREQRHQDRLIASQVGIRADEMRNERQDLEEEEDHGQKKYCSDNNDLVWESDSRFGIRGLGTLLQVRDFDSEYVNRLADRIGNQVSMFVRQDLGRPGRIVL